MGSSKERQLRSNLKNIEKASFKLLETIQKKMDSGQLPSDEEVRYIKKFTSLIKELDLMRETSEELVKKPITNEKLKRLIEHHEKYAMNAKVVMPAAGYYKCDVCLYWHKKEEGCPF